MKEKELPRGMRKETFKKYENFRVLNRPEGKAREEFGNPFSQIQKSCDDPHLKLLKVNTHLWLMKTHLVFYSLFWRQTFTFWRQKLQNHT